MPLKRKYEIVANVNGRRVLVVRSLFPIELTDTIDYDDFDAIFIDYTPGYSVNTSLVWMLMPMLKNKSWLKPTFLSIQFKEKYDRWSDAFDGYAISPTEEDMTRRVEEIIQKVEESGISRTRTKVVTNEDLLINLCRFCLSRGERLLSNRGIFGGEAHGYHKILTCLFGDTSFLDTAARFDMNLLKLGYMRERKFLERIHVCPSCSSSHLLFVECCPTCGSSDIRNEPVIHHFRCANISPESSYQFDGDLRCPKCQRFLRHIGVDYDKPASLYTCANCSHIFMTPELKVSCVNCARHYKPEELRTFDVREYVFTDKGVKAMASNEIRLNLSQEVYAGVLADFEEFALALEQLILVNARFQDNRVFVGRIKIAAEYANQDSKLEYVMSALLTALPQYRMVAVRDMFYIMGTAQKNKVELMQDTTIETIRDLFSTDYSAEDTPIYSTEWFVYSSSMQIRDFIQLIKYEQS